VLESKTKETTVPSINPQRLLGDLYALRKIGTYKTGVHRPTFSAEDIAARNWFAEQCTAAGMDTTIDGIGNILGKSKAAGAKALSGSHLESQNHAGWLDGPLGCVYALEAARAIREAGGDTGVDVVVFCDEEGHYGSFLGSKSFTGLLKDEDIDKAKNRHDGTPMRDGLARAGWNGRPRLVIEPERYKAFFEAHIEQGDTLETEKLRIGVVTAIVAIWQYSFTATGEQNHAGTTSMARRRDAGLALVRLLSAIDQRFPQICGPRTVWTAGRMTFDPGSHSIIPGRAEALFQLRDADPAVLDRLHAELYRLVDEANKDSRCELAINVISQSTPAKMDERLMTCLDIAAERHAPGKHIRMPSGAGHDAQWLARKLPAAMMFVPSIGGISHHWSENTSDEDLVLGAQVFTDGIAEALRG
jgi:N-carbamoyl-L-amino-acid hydrolase